MTRPKVVFLENVQNLLSHDGKATFRTIIDTLDRQLNYHVVGAEYNDKGELINVTDAFYEIQKILEYHRTDREYTLSPLVEIILVYI